MIDLTPACCSIFLHVIEANVSLSMYRRQDVPLSLLFERAWAVYEDAYAKQAKVRIVVSPLNLSSMPLMAVYIFTSNTHCPPMTAAACRTPYVGSRQPWPGPQQWAFCHQMRRLMTLPQQTSSICCCRTCKATCCQTPGRGTPTSVWLSWKKQAPTSCGTRAAFDATA